MLNALLKFPVAWGFKKLNGRVGGLTPEELGSAIAESMDIPGYPACFYDPKHFERVKTIEANVKRNNTMLEAMEDGALAGKFGCLWKDTEVTLTSNRIKRLAGESSEG